MLCDGLRCVPSKMCPRRRGNGAEFTGHTMPNNMLSQACCWDASFLCSSRFRNRFSHIIFQLLIQARAPIVSSLPPYFIALGQNPFFHPRVGDFKDRLRSIDALYGLLLFLGRPVLPSDRRETIHSKDVSYFPISFM